MHDDLSRRRTPRNGEGLSAQSRAHVAAVVDFLVEGLDEIARRLKDGRRLTGDRSWRRECLTREQRRAVKRAVARVRKQARRL